MSARVITIHRSPWIGSPRTPAAPIREAGLSSPLASPPRQLYQSTTLVFSSSFLTPTRRHPLNSIRPDNARTPFLADNSSRPSHHPHSSPSTIPQSCTTVLSPDMFLQPPAVSPTPLSHPRLRGSASQCSELAPRLPNVLPPVNCCPDLVLALGIMAVGVDFCRLSPALQFASWT
jgi:hypothetical protein